MSDDVLPSEQFVLVLVNVWHEACDDRAQIQALLGCVCTEVGQIKRMQSYRCQ